jgi:hypothetical protein
MQVEHGAVCPWCVMEHGVQYRALCTTWHEHRRSVRHLFPRMHAWLPPQHHRSLLRRISVSAPLFTRCCVA